MPNIKDKRVSKQNTICEKHRQIYDEIIELNIPEAQSIKIIDLLNDCYVMSKKMNNKLRQYKNNYDNNWWKENRDFKKIFKNRKKRF